MSPRLAVGYEIENIDRPTAVFIEHERGIELRRRDDPAPRLIADPIDRHATRFAPGQPEYFDAVLETFSNNVLIRTVVDEQRFLSALLASNGDIWDRLPEPVTLGIDALLA